jgi:FkbM family methyltransferase
MLRSLIEKVSKKVHFFKVKSSAETPACKQSFSQCGEDVLVQYIFNLRGLKNPSYIDIGANDPFFINNTAIFYKSGSRGINIEANNSLIEKFRIHRPEDQNLNIGIGSKECELDFYILNDPTLSTFSRVEANTITATGKYWVTEVQRKQIYTIDKVLEEYNDGLFPDFFSLDVEGMDFEILKSIDFHRHHPKVICVEAAEYSPIGAGDRRSDLINFLVSKGYYEYANTNLNAIMVKNEFWFI